MVKFSPPQKKKKKKKKKPFIIFFGGEGGKFLYILVLDQKKYKAFRIHQTL